MSLLHIRSVASTVLLFIGSIQAQQPSPPSGSVSATAFEVASVKRSAPDAQGSLISGPAPSAFTTRNAALRNIIQYAYGIADYQLVDAPSWTRSERFDIVAKYPEGDNRGRVPEMVQALLADRFALKVHKDVREGPIFELVTARSDGRLGPRLRRSEVDCVTFRTALKESGRGQTIGPGDFPTCMMIASDRFIKGGNRTMDTFSRSLARYVERRVVDRTGLDGEFDIELEWSPATETAASNPTGVARSSPDDTLSIYTALREQLGLELKSARGSIDVIVVDSVEPPTPD
jgi:uncharacterized protein (TIGR03435 family)